MTTTIEPAAHPCRRCSAQGEIPKFQHVKGGVCFRCWGTKRDLAAVAAELRRNLRELREEYSRARQKGATAEALKEIEVRGLAARHAYDRQMAENQALRAQFQN